MRTNRGRMWGGGLVVATVLVLGAAACGGGSGDDDVAGADRDSRDPLPLDAWQVSIGRTEDSAQEEERRVENRIAECMTGRGFEYTPVEPHPGSSSAAQEDGPWSLPHDEFAESYGYGIFTIDHPGLVDPNAARVATMSEAERSAYNEALMGVPTDEGEPAEVGGSGEDEDRSTSGPADEPAEGESGPAEGDDPVGDDEPVPDEPAPDDDQPARGEGDDESLGCIDEAWNAEFTTELMTSEAFGGFNEDLEALEESIDRDPEVEEATRAWADCMADADYSDFDVPDNAVSSVVDRFAELFPEQAEQGLNGLETISAFGFTLHRVRGVDVASLDPTTVQELRDYEIDVAVADDRCRNDLEAAHYEARAELEEQFVEDHRDELDRLAEAWAANAGEG